MSVIYGLVPYLFLSPLPDVCYLWSGTLSVVGSLTLMTTLFRGMLYGRWPYCVHYTADVVVRRLGPPLMTLVPRVSYGHGYQSDNRHIVTPVSTITVCSH